jgi:hypothetical protein
MSSGHCHYCHFGRDHRMVPMRARTHMWKVTCRRVQSGSGDLPILAAGPDGYGGVASKSNRLSGPRPKPKHAPSTARHFSERT